MIYLLEMVPIKRANYIAIVLIVFAMFSGCEERRGLQTDSLPTKGNLSELMNSMGVMPLNESETAPEFELLSIDGQTVSLGQYRDKVILLSFWATW